MTLDYSTTQQSNWSSTHGFTRIIHCSIHWSVTSQHRDASSMNSDVIHRHNDVTFWLEQVRTCDNIGEWNVKCIEIEAFKLRISPLLGLALAARSKCARCSGVVLPTTTYITALHASHRIISLRGQSEHRLHSPLTPRPVPFSVTSQL